MSTVTKPIALDETLQSTNIALGSLGKDTTLQAIATAIANVGLSNIGNMSSLATTDKTSLVSAINEVVGDVSDLDTDKADKVTSATNGNLAGLNGSGNLTDSGWASDKTTTSASGNPISITGLKSNQLAVNPMITFEPIQAGSGTPSPSNIREISGYDRIDVLSCGKNILPLTLDNIKKASVNGSPTGSWSGNTWSGGGITIEVQYDNYGNVSGLKANGTANQNILFVFASGVNLKYSQYTFSGCPSGGTAETYRMDARNMASITMLDIGKGVTFQAATGNNGYVLIRVQQGTSVSNLVFKPQLEESATKTAFELYHKTTDLSESLGQTVYGGSLDIRTGKLTVEFVKKVYDGSSDETWTKDGQSFYIAENTLPKESTYTTNIIKCDRLQTVERSSLIGTGEVTNAISGYKDTSSSYPNQNWIYIGISGISDVASLKTWLSNNPIEVTFKVINSAQTTIQLTPHEISLLKDYAYVSTNGTSMSFDYHNGEIATLGDVAQLGETVNEIGNGLFKAIKITRSYGNVTSGTRYSYCITDDYPFINNDSIIGLSHKAAGGSQTYDYNGLVNWVDSNNKIYISYVCQLTQNNVSMEIYILYK